MHADEEFEPTEKDLNEVELHMHVCGNCNASYHCAEGRIECEEPFLCAECALTEGEDGDD